MLKQDGFIYNFDWRKIKNNIGPPFEIRLSEEDVAKLASEAGLKITYQNIFNKHFYEMKLTKLA